MKRLASLVLLVSIAVSASVSTGDAAWKKRGWYMKKQGVTCVMRKVAVAGYNGKVAVQKIRVCG